MGDVYLGRSPEPDGRLVAVKVVRADLAADPEFLRLFEREARFARRVARFCTAEVLDDGTDGGRPYLVTEYVDGPSLADAVGSDGPLVGASLERVAVAVATALTAIHGAGMIHRDLKPSNVLLSGSGPLVIDFGIAHALDGTTQLTRDARSGTPAYMAPEQARGEQVGPAADVFAWGGVVVFAATGRPPFGTGRPDALLYRVVHERPDLDGVPEPLRAVVEEAMRADPAQRPTARQLYARMIDTQVVADPVSPAGAGRVTGVNGSVPPPPGPPPSGPTGRRSGRRRVASAIAAALVLAVVAAVVIITRPDGHPANAAVLGGCRQIDVFTGQPTSPYFRYGQVLERKIEGAFPGSAVNVKDTPGSSDNLQRVRDPAAASCGLAVIQLNVGVDARAGVYHFEGEKFEGVRTVGPLWFDFLQLLVRRDSPVRAAADLCGGKTVATGLRQSGTQEIGAVLFRQVRRQVPGCALTEVSRTLPDGLAQLRAGAVDAVLWAGGAPTSEIRDAVEGGLAVRLLPLDGYRDAMQKEWDAFYGSKLGSAFVAGEVYQIGRVESGDYPGVDPVGTVAVPNGVAVAGNADPALVRFTAESLFDVRAEFERELWGGAQNGRHFPSARDTVGASSLYCLVPLHDAVVPYYREMGVRPPCPGS
jgi:TRAP transporter TAXI family solute receptor